jgi:hypothetical protein
MLPDLTAVIVGSDSSVPNSDVPHHRIDREQLAKKHEGTAEAYGLNARTRS